MVARPEEEDQLFQVVLLEEPLPCFVEELQVRPGPLPAVLLARDLLALLVLQGQIWVELVSHWRVV